MKEDHIQVSSALSEFELLGQNSHLLDAFFTLYAELMPEYTNYVERMRQRAAQPVDVDPCFTEHYRLFTVDGDAAALTTYKFLPARRCGLGIDLAVGPKYRGLEVSGCGRFAEYVIVSILEQISKDAEMLNAPEPVGLFVEVGSERLVARYRAYGFQEIPIEYSEPSFPADVVAHVEPFDPDEMTFVKRHVGLFPTRQAEFDPYDQEAIENLALAFLVDHYQLPAEHWAVRRTLESIEKYCRAGGKET